MIYIYNYNYISNWIIQPLISKLNILQGLTLVKSIDDSFLVTITCVVIKLGG